MERFRMELESLSKNEEFARVVVTVFISRLDPTLEEIDDVKTAVSEAVTNAEIHGYGGESGTITVEEAEHHPQKNIITKALGVDYRLDSEFTTAPLQKGDILLLCSDGLTNAVPREQLEQLLRTGRFYDLPDLLIRTANENGGPDNITALLLCVEEVR